MRFGKPKVRETLELFKDALARGRVDPPIFHTRHEIALEGLHALRAALSTHRAAQLIGTRAGQACGVRRDTHELFLKKWNAERLLQSGLQERVQVGHLLAS